MTQDGLHISDSSQGPRPVSLSDVAVTVLEECLATHVLATIPENSVFVYSDAEKRQLYGPSFGRFLRLSTQRAQTSLHYNTCGTLLFREFVF